MTIRLEGFTQCRQRGQRPRRQFNHPAYEIDAPYLFGYAVFNLQAGVDFQEIKPLGAAVVDKFDGARAAVVDRFTQLNRRLTQCIFHAGRQVRRGGLFQHLLVAALYRAVAHAEGNDVSSAVAKQLYFKVSRPFDVFLDKHARVAKVVFPQSHHGVERVVQLFSAIAHAHADTTAARRAFQHHRIADLLSSVQRFVHIRQQFRAFQHRYTVQFRQRTRGMFQPEQTQLFRCGANKGDPCFFTGFRKRRIFRQKPITWVNSLGATGLRRSNQFVYHQVSIGRRALAQAQGFIRFTEMQAADISLRIDRHAAKMHGAQGTQDAAGNRPAVRNQECRQHRSDSIVAGRPAGIWLTHGRPRGQRRLRQEASGTDFKQAINHLTQALPASWR